MARCHAFFRYFNSWPSTSRLCSANHLRCTGAWGCKLIKQGTSQRFSKETRTSRDTLDVAYVRNDFYVLTMLIDHWEPERRKTFQQVLAKHIPYSVIYSRSSSEVEIHLHIVSPRSIFGIFMTQEPTEGFERWSNGLWDGIGASWCQWSDPMGVENWHEKLKVYFRKKKTIFSFANEANWKLKLQCVSLWQLHGDARPNGGIMFRSWNDDNSPNCNRVAS